MVFRQPSHTLRKTLSRSVWDGVFFSLMVGVGETYLAALALALGFSQVLAGLVVVIPVLSGSSLQLLSGWGLRRIGSPRRWVAYCAFTQSLCLLGIAGIAYNHLSYPPLLFVVASLYWASGMSAGPAWNAWMGDLIPERFRLTFFSLRGRLTQSAIFLGLILGGLVLHQWADEHNRLEVFAALFLAAALFRGISAILLLWHQKEISSRHFKYAMPEFSPSLFFAGKAVLFLYLYFFLIQLTVQVSGPFYTPYMLKQLHLNYAQYMMLIGSAFMGRVLAYALLTSVAKRYGATALIVLGTLGIMPIPMLWSLSQEMSYLVILQIFAGGLWASHELGMFLLLIETYPAELRSKVLTWVNFVNAIGMILGSLIGVHVLESGVLNMETYHQVFRYSSMLRVLPVLCLPFFVSRRILQIPIFTRILGVRPDMGSMDRPILYVADKKVKRPED